MSQSRQSRRGLLVAGTCAGTFTLSSMTALACGRPEDANRNWFNDVSAGYGQHPYRDNEKRVTPAMAVD